MATNRPPLHPSIRVDAKTAYNAINLEAFQDDEDDADAGDEESLLVDYHTNNNSNNSNMPEQGDSEDDGAGVDDDDDINYDDVIDLTTMGMMGSRQQHRNQNQQQNQQQQQHKPAPPPPPPPPPPRSVGSFSPSSNKGKGNENDDESSSSSDTAVFFGKNETKTKNKFLSLTVQTQFHDDHQHRDDDNDGGATGRGSSTNSSPLMGAGLDTLSPVSAVATARAEAATPTHNSKSSNAGAGGGRGSTTTNALSPSSSKGPTTNSINSPTTAASNETAGTRTSVVRVFSNRLKAPPSSSRQQQQQPVVVQVATTTETSSATVQEENNQSHEGTATTTTTPTATHHGNGYNGSNSGARGVSHNKNSMGTSHENDNMAATSGSYQNSTSTASPSNHPYNGPSSPTSRFGTMFRKAAQRIRDRRGRLSPRKGHHHRNNMVDPIIEPPTPDSNAATARSFQGRIEGEKQLQQQSSQAKNQQQQQQQQDEMNRSPPAYVEVKQQNYRGSSPEPTMDHPHDECSPRHDHHRQDGGGNDDYDDDDDDMPEDLQSLANDSRSYPTFTGRFTPTDTMSTWTGNTRRSMMWNNMSVASSSRASHQRPPMELTVVSRHPPRANTPSSSEYQTYQSQQPHHHHHNQYHHSRPPQHLFVTHTETHEEAEEEDDVQDDHREAVRAQEPDQEQGQDHGGFGNKDQAFGHGLWDSNITTSSGQVNPSKSNSTNADTTTTTAASREMIRSKSDGNTTSWTTSEASQTTTEAPVSTGTMSSSDLDSSSRHNDRSSPFAQDADFLVQNHRQHQTDLAPPRTNNSPATVGVLDAMRNQRGNLFSSLTSLDESSIPAGSTTAHQLPMSQKTAADREERLTALRARRAERENKSGSAMSRASPISRGEGDWLRSTTSPHIVEADTTTTETEEAGAAPMVEHRQSFTTTPSNARQTQVESDPRMAWLETLRAKRRNMLTSLTHHRPSSDAQTPTLTMTKPASSYGIEAESKISSDRLSDEHENEFSSQTGAAEDQTDDQKEIIDVESEEDHFDDDESLTQPSSDDTPVSQTISDGPKYRLPPTLRWNRMATPTDTRTELSRNLFQMNMTQPPESDDILNVKDGKEAIGEQISMFSVEDLQSNTSVRFNQPLAQKRGTSEEENEQIIELVSYEQDDSINPHSYEQDDVGNGSIQDLSERHSVIKIPSEDQEAKEVVNVTSRDQEDNMIQVGPRDTSDNLDETMSEEEVILLEPDGEAPLDDSSRRGWFFDVKEEAGDKSVPGEVAVIQITRSIEETVCGGSVESSKRVTFRKAHRSEAGDPDPPESPNARCIITVVSSESGPRESVAHVGSVVGVGDDKESSIDPASIIHVSPMAGESGYNTRDFNASYQHSRKRDPLPSKAPAREDPPTLSDNENHDSGGDADPIQPRVPTEENKRTQILQRARTVLAAQLALRQSAKGKSRKSTAAAKKIGLNDSSDSSGSGQPAENMANHSIIDLIRMEEEIEESVNKKDGQSSNDEEEAETENVQISGISEKALRTFTSATSEQAVCDTSAADEEKQSGASSSIGRNSTAEEPDSPFENIRRRLVRLDIEDFRSVVMAKGGKSQDGKFDKSLRMLVDDNDEIEESLKAQKSKKSPASVYSQDLAMSDCDNSVGEEGKPARNDGKNTDESSKTKQNRSAKEEELGFKNVMDEIDGPTPTDEVTLEETTRATATTGHLSASKPDAPGIRDQEKIYKANRSKNDVEKKKPSMKDSGANALGKNSNSGKQKSKDDTDCKASEIKDSEKQSKSSRSKNKSAAPATILKKQSGSKEDDAGAVDLRAGATGSKKKSYMVLKEEKQSSNLPETETVEESETLEDDIEERTIKILQGLGLNETLTGSHVENVPETAGSTAHKSTPDKPEATSSLASRTTPTRVRFNDATPVTVDLTGSYNNDGDDATEATDGSLTRDSISKTSFTDESHESDLETAFESSTVPLLVRMLDRGCAWLEDTNTCGLGPPPSLLRETRAKPPTPASVWEENKKMARRNRKKQEKAKGGKAIVSTIHEQPQLPETLPKNQSKPRSSSRSCSPSSKVPGQAEIPALAPDEAPLVVSKVAATTTGRSILQKVHESEKTIFGTTSCPDATKPVPSTASQSSQASSAHSAGPKSNRPKFGRKARKGPRSTKKAKSVFDLQMFKSNADGQYKLSSGFFSKASDSSSLETLTDNSSYDNPIRLEGLEELGMSSEMASTSSPFGVHTPKASNMQKDFAGRETYDFHPTPKNGPFSKVSPFPDPENRIEQYERRPLPKNVPLVMRSKSNPAGDPQSSEDVSKNIIDVTSSEYFVGSQPSKDVTVANNKGPATKDEKEEQVAVSSSHKPTSEMRVVHFDPEPLNEELWKPEKEELSKSPRRQGLPPSPNMDRWHQATIEVNHSTVSELTAHEHEATMLSFQDKLQQRLTRVRRIGPALREDDDMSEEEDDDGFYEVPHETRDPEEVISDRLDDDDDDSLRNKNEDKHGERRRRLDSTKSDEENKQVNNSQKETTHSAAGGSAANMSNTRNSHSENERLAALALAEKLRQRAAKLKEKRRQREKDEAATKKYHKSGSGDSIKTPRAAAPRPEDNNSVVSARVVAA